MRGSHNGYFFETGQLPGAPRFWPSAQLLLCSPAAHQHPVPTPRHIKQQKTEHCLWRHCKCATNLLATMAGVIERVHCRTGCRKVVALTTWPSKKEAYKRRCCGCGSTEQRCAVSYKGKLLPSVSPELPWQYFTTISDRKLFYNLLFILTFTYMTNNHLYKDIL